MLNHIGTHVSHPDIGAAARPPKPITNTVFLVSASVALGLVALVAIAVLCPTAPWSRDGSEADGSAAHGRYGFVTSAWSDGLGINTQQEPGDGDAEDSEADSDQGGYEAWLAKIFPDYGFHPLVIHFPIALFLFGTLLELIGWWRRDFRIRQAAFWNLAAASLSTLVVIPTGAIAFILSDYTWKGMVVYHMAFAGAAAILMAATVLWRRKGPHTSRKYFAVLITSTVVLGIAGYYGGELIYGL